jgi:hypothetical protein
MRKKCGLLKLVMKAKQQAFHWFISMYSAIMLVKNTAHKDRELNH